MKEYISALLVLLVFSGCGGGDDSSVAEVPVSTFNADFEKFNSALVLLPASALNPQDYSEPTLFTENEWVITKKKGTDFYISEISKTNMRSTAQEALDYCAVHLIDSQALHWRVPTNNELLVISELYNAEAFFWSSDITSTYFGDYMDSVRLSDGFICQAQYVYDTNTEFGLTQHYCNEELSGKFVGCVASIY